MIALIDYGSGNVRSVFNALKSLGADVRLTADPAEISRAEKIVLPGVGAFGDCVRGLEERGLWHVMRDMLDSGVPSLANGVGNLPIHLIGRHRGEVRKGLVLLRRLIGLNSHVRFPSAYLLEMSSLSTVSNSHLISFQVSIAILSSGEC
jgi:glutamine amidotransferase